MCRLLVAFPVTSRDVCMYVCMHHDGWGHGMPNARDADGPDDMGRHRCDRCSCLRPGGAARHLDRGMLCLRLGLGSFGCGGGRGSLTSAADPDPTADAPEWAIKGTNKQSRGRDDGTAAGTDQAHYDGPARRAWLTWVNEITTGPSRGEDRWPPWRIMTIGYSGPSPVRPVGHLGQAKGQPGGNYLLGR